MSIPAVRLLAWESDPELVQVERPSPGPGGVLLKIDAAGLCHSDLHLMHDWPAGTLPYELPFTLGHENAGTVAELGGHGGGVGFDGGLAEYMLVPDRRYLVPIGDLDPLRAAPLTDAALTPYHALNRSRHQIRPDGRAVVIGVGGIGHMAVQILRSICSMPIVAVDLRPEALELARGAGASATLSADGLTSADLLTELGGPANLVLDCVANETTLALASSVLALGGDLSYVGRGGGKLQFAPGPIP